MWVRLHRSRGEEVQVPVSPSPAVDITLNGLLTGLGIALLFTVAAFYWKGRLTPYVLLVLSLLPLLLAYFWLFISTVSRRTEGLTPVNVDGDFGGFTFEHWRFITKSEHNPERDLQHICHCGNHGHPGPAGIFDGRLCALKDEICRSTQLSFADADPARLPGCDPAPGDFLCAAEHQQITSAR
jgi:hypothetical protein